MEKWYVISTKPKKEFDVEKLFHEGGITVYTPRYRDGDRIKPFFPGYQFILFIYPEQYKLVKYTRGVKRIVGNDEGPIALDDKIIGEMKAREIDGYIEFAKYGLEPSIGDEIEVVEGPLKGLRGIFKKDLTGQDRVMILLNYVSYQGQLLIEKKKLKKVIY
ncbi:MAG: transcription termination/antitermination NusG family protein [Candidatus Aminicenantes bacterium]|nr:transcription termination/antitermination NusG family protein [Candidatus Aminicenantes bacterium]